MMTRLTSFLMLLVVIVLGLLSRRLMGIPLWIGDSLWAMALLLTFRLVRPQSSLRLLASLTMVVSALVEGSQLIQWTWLRTIRQTLIGHLLLGQGFLWSDLLAYAIGIMLIVWVIYLLEKLRKNGRSL